MSFYLDEKIKNIFPEESIYKMPGGYSYFSGLNLPSFIKDWLIKKFTNVNDEVDEEGLNHFLEEHLPGKDSNITGNLIQGHTITILARIIVEVNIASGEYRFGLPDLGIKTKDGKISKAVIRANPNLGEGEFWGIVTLEYRERDEEKVLSRGYIEMTGFQAFKPYSANYEYYKEARKEFTVDEWIDFLIASMEYNPSSESFDSLDTKLLFLSRLLVFVEPNLNLIELAPKGTGKSYVFNNLSKYGWQISGGKVTRAKLFYNMSTQTPGIIANYDFISMDEIKTISFDNPSELQGALKNYLEQGSFTVGKSKQVSSCGLILLGNIDLSQDKKPVNRRYFDELPEVFHDPALVDRFHGFLEGWKLPRLNNGMFFRGYSLNVEYFSEVLNSMRSDPIYMTVADALLHFPSNSDARDSKAIKRLCSGYLKLLFPNVKRPEDISPEDFYNYCFVPAFEKRAIIRQQLCIMDPEFKPEMPNVKVRGYND